MRTWNRSIVVSVLAATLHALAATPSAALEIRDAPIGQRTAIQPHAMSPSPLVAGSGNHFLYPASANVPGAFGSYFKTKITILNVTNGTYDIRTGLSTGAGEIDAKLIRIRPFESLTSDNFVNEVFDGYVGGGAIDLDSTYDGRTDHLFLTNAVVYVDVAGGGRYTMAIQPADFLGFVVPGRPGILVGVSVNSVTRTNIGCASNSGRTERMTAQAFYADGSAASNVFAVDIGAFGWTQLGISASSFNNGTVLITGTGSLACYGTEINNVTNDATFYLAIPY